MTAREGVFPNPDYATLYGDKELYARAEAIAERFHAEYERLAPSYGYETRRESAVPWEGVPVNNRRLMTHTVANLLIDEVIE